MALHHIPAYAMLIAALASGCGYVPNRNTSVVDTAREEAATSLNATANDITKSPEERCEAIFALFRDHIKPGSAARDMQAVLTNTNWLERDNLRDVILSSVSTGLTPVRSGRGNAAFVLDVLPVSGPSDGSSPRARYCIYFTLSGKDSHTENEAVAFLQGTTPHDQKTFLKEFTLCYPDGRIVQVDKSGAKETKLY